jgi:hypothetical protein
MPKRPMELTIRIPDYAFPRNTSRTATCRAVVERERMSSVRYEPTDRLELLHPCLEPRPGRGRESGRSPRRRIKCLQCFPG